MSSMRAEAVASDMIGRGRMVKSRTIRVYSYSKLRVFETCPLKFRFRYLERVPTDLESIEGFTGKRVHEVLEALYGSLAVDPRPPELGEVLTLYDEAWKRAWHGDVEIVKEGYSLTDYHRLGGRCLTTFYRGNWPFTADRTLELETAVEFNLGAGGPRVIGVLDRLAARAAGELLIHDYKTSTYLPRKGDILGDLQLAIYQLGTAERWPGRDVTLVWHFLAFGRRVKVRLGSSGLEEKRAELGRRIATIERAVMTNELKPRVSRLCLWCSYRQICPAYAESEYFQPHGPSGRSAVLPMAGWPVSAAAQALPVSQPWFRLRPLRRRRRRRTSNESLAQLRLL